MFCPCLCVCVCCSAASTHASHQWVSNEKKPEAHRLEGHDAGAAPGYSQWPALPDWEWVSLRRAHSTAPTHKHSLTAAIFNCRIEQESEWGKICTRILTHDQFREPCQLTASPEHLLSPRCTHRWSCFSAMNKLSPEIRTAPKIPMSPKSWLFKWLLQNRLSPHISCPCLLFSITAEGTIAKTCDLTTATTTDVWLSLL